MIVSGFVSWAPDGGWVVGRARWVLGLLMLLAASAGSTAAANVVATASVTPKIQYVGDTAGTTFSFTVTDGSTASESLGSVRITRPGVAWTITGCPGAPLGWVRVKAVSSCTYNSAPGIGDNIAAGATAHFKVKATTAAGSADVTGMSWDISVNQADTYTTIGATSASAATTGALSAAIYTWQVVSAVVAPLPSSVGSACPAANSSATAGSAIVLVVCGENHANTALTPASVNSTLTGSLIAAKGTFSSATVAAQSSASVVLANYAGSRVRSTIASGLTVIASIGSSSTQTSPAQRLAGYTTTAGWTKFHYDLANSGVNANETTLGVGNVSNLVQKWMAQTPGGSIFSSVAIVNGMAYFGSTNNRLYVEDANGVTNCVAGTCDALWAGDTGNQVASSPSVVNGVVYVGSGDGKLYAFNAGGCGAQLCSPLWTAATGAAIYSSPAVVNGVVYIGSSDDKLYAFDAKGVKGCSGTPKTCQPLWTAPTGGRITYSAPAVVNGVVYIGSEDHSLYAFDAHGVTNCSGTPKICMPLWTAPTGNAVYSSPAVVNGVVYVGSQDHNLYAFDATGVTNCSGTPKICTPLWMAPTAGGVQSSPAVANGVVYVGSEDDNLYAFDANGVTGCSGTPTTCSPLWTATITAFPIDSSPTVENGVVYVGSSNQEVQAYDASGTINCSGTPKVCTPLWHTPSQSGGTIYDSPIVVNGTLYYGSGNGSVYAFGLP